MTDQLAIPAAAVRTVWVFTADLPEADLASSAARMTPPGLTAPRRWNRPSAPGGWPPRTWSSSWPRPWPITAWPIT